jgi:hypothetical protein
VVREVETLVHRLDSKIDALAGSYLKLLKDGRLSGKTLSDVARSLRAVEAQAEHNKSMFAQLATELFRARKETVWADKLEALNLDYALSTDADDVLEDCAKLRDVLLIYKDGVAVLRTFQPLDIQANDFVQAQIAAWSVPSPNVWSFALEPEESEPVEDLDFIDERKFESDRQASIKEARHAEIDAVVAKLRAGSTILPEVRADGVVNAEDMAKLKLPVLLEIDETLL